ncbi:MAG TPA: hypothetical protein VI755_15895 [Anaerolineales bacterium]|nr:hypothetical protein [Anaerolineales bacterium]
MAQFKSAVVRRITQVDAEIDLGFYELYGLTEKIEFVEVRHPKGVLWNSIRKDIIADQSA